MEVIVLDDDAWWRNRVARELTEAGHRCHLYDGPDFRPDALEAWRKQIGVGEAAAIVDLALDHEYDEDVGRASLEALSRWAALGYACRPLLFMSGSLPVGLDERGMQELGGVFVGRKGDIDDWPALLSTS